MSRRTDQMPGRILVVDDEVAMCGYIAEVLEDAGYVCEVFSDSVAALDRVLSGDSNLDLIFSDIRMPGLDGIDFLRIVGQNPSTAPFVFLSGQYGDALAINALQLGAADYLYKPVRPGDLLAMAEKHCLPGLSQRMAIGAALDDYLRVGDVACEQSLEQLLHILGKLGLKRVETHQHAIRVSRYAMLLGESLGFDATQLHTLKVAAILHDIGKILTPYNVLMKPGKLTERECGAMRLHVQLGWEVLSPFRELYGAAEIVLAHHERFDGGGYPRGLLGTEILLSARVVAAADTLDAIQSDRPYRSGRSLNTARRIVRENSGSQFDPAVVEALQGLPDYRLLRIHAEAPDEA